MRVALTSLAAVLMMSVAVMSAGVPNVMNYQGRLTDAAGDPVADGAYLVKFIIYDAATGGTDLWNSGFQSVTTTDGLFSYDLGANVTLPDLFGTDPNRYLGITVGTDPEISPRTRFTSTGYVFKSLKSDLASDANSLGGLIPAFYLDWSNLTSVPVDLADGVIDWTEVTNIPAGFADGVDDEGLDQSTADGRYVNKTGDVMTGDLNLQASGVDRITLDADGGSGINFFQNGSGNQTARLWGPAVGELQLWDGQNPPVNTVDMFAAGNGGELHLRNTSGLNTILLRGNLTGNSSVILPADAISSSEMFDEPGIAKGVNSGQVTLTTTMQDIATVTITIPGPGYIFVTGRCWVAMGRDATLGSNQLSFQIDETAGGPNLQSQSVFPSSSIPSSTIQQAVYVDRAYFKSVSGTFTFRIEGFKFSSGGGLMRAGNGSATAMFFPTSYGSVATVAGQPGDHPDAKQVSITGQDGSTITGYEMDLRYYEEKARAARIAKQKAELAEAEAELELIQAKATANQK